MESELAKIIRKSSRKPVSCKCVSCQSQCMREPCLGTPSDIQKIKDAGFSDRIVPTAWAAGILLRVTTEVIEMEQPLFDPLKGSCTFFNNGLCELHDLGLKPTEGKLSHHSIKKDNYNGSRSLSWLVAKTWIK